MVFLVDIVLWSVLYPQAKHHSEHSDDDDACCEKFLNFGENEEIGVFFDFSSDVDDRVV